VGLKFIKRSNFITKWNCRTKPKQSRCNLPHLYLQCSPSSI